MIKEKISSQEIIDLIASKASVSKRASEEFLKVMIATIEEALLKGDFVKIKNFGTFKLQWNEPRKSVNIQTSEEIILAGYYKVVFTPDAVLKTQVNEPFAHLEPVELDSKSTKNIIDEENDEVPLDPLRIFTEQAFEIKNLISEIQGLSAFSKSTISEENRASVELLQEEITEENVQIEQNTLNQSVDEDLILIEEQEEIIPFNVLDNSDYVYIPDDSVHDIEYFNEVEAITAENESLPIDSELPVTPYLNELPVTPYLNNITSHKKSKMWIWALIIIIVISGIGTGFYFTYPHANELTKTTIENCKYTLNFISDKISYSKIKDTVSNWFAPTVKQAPLPQTVFIPKETNDFDSISQNQQIDSLQVLFDNPRVYNDFIATEKFKSGNRLTIMSKRYYGAKEYWVYIYEANKDQITNPDDIKVGTMIRIPKLDSRLIDPENPRCLKKAMELHDIYIK